MSRKHQIAKKFIKELNYDLINTLMPSVRLLLDKKKKLKAGLGTLAEKEVEALSGKILADIERWGHRHENIHKKMKIPEGAVDDRMASTSEVISTLQDLREKVNQTQPSKPEEDTNPPELDKNMSITSIEDPDNLNEENQDTYSDDCYDYDVCADPLDPADDYDPDEGLDDPNDPYYLGDDYGEFHEFLIKRAKEESQPPKK